MVKETKEKLEKYYGYSAPSNTTVKGGYKNLSSVVREQMTNLVPDGLQT